MRREYNLRSLLPSGYRQLEYIYTPLNNSYTGPQYIDTSYIPSITTELELDYQDDSNMVGTNYMGVRSPNLAILTYGSARKIGAMVNGVSNIQAINWDKYRHYYKLNRYGFWVDGVKKTSINGSAFTTTKTVWIFQAHNNLGSMATDTYSKGYLYAAKIIDNGTVVRYYVPALRLLDSKPGLYDLCGSICPLTGTPFYINAGTGEFLYA